MLGRCHAALGQHELAVSAFDAAINLGSRRRLLMQEALAVRGRALAGRVAGAADGGAHWAEETGRARLAEVMGRMQTPVAGRPALARALGEE